MRNVTIRAASVCALAAAIGAAAAGCSGSATKTSTPTTPTTPTPPPIVINAPIPQSPSDAAVVTAWPTLTVSNAVRTGPAGTLVYRFEIATGSDFSNITVTSTVAEGNAQTSYTPAAPLPADQTTLYWRVYAIDSVNAVQSPASDTQSLRFSNPPTRAAQVAAQEGIVLWPGAAPTGNPGSATMGNGWTVSTLVSYDGVKFTSPTLDELQVFDCMDRGMQPQQAIDWLHGHGYQTGAAWFPSVAVIGFAHQYLALINGRWDMVLRAGA